jgi:hypothetical protein
MLIYFAGNKCRKFEEEKLFQKLEKVLFECGF